MRFVRVRDSHTSGTSIKLHMVLLSNYLFLKRGIFVPISVCNLCSQGSGFALSTNRNSCYSKVRVAALWISVKPLRDHNKKPTNLFPSLTIKTSSLSPILCILLRSSLRCHCVYSCCVAPDLKTDPVTRRITFKCYQVWKSFNHYTKRVLIIQATEPVSHTQKNTSADLFGFCTSPLSEMARVSKLGYSGVLGKGLSSVRVKIDNIKAEIKEADERKKRAEEGIGGQVKRERKARDCKAEILDRIQQREVLIEKAEIRLGYLKERGYVAEWRKNESASMRVYLEKNLVDFSSEELDTTKHEERAKEMVRNIAAKNRYIQAREKDIAAAEQREFKARGKIALLNEKLIAAEHTTRRVTINYTPRSVTDCEREVRFLRQDIDDCVERMRRRNRKADALEKKAAEVQQSLEMIKKRKRELEQTMNELRGARV